MDTLRRMFICSNHQAMWILFILHMCESFINPGVVSNRLLELGLRDSLSTFFIWGSLHLWLTTLSSFFNPQAPLSTCYYMWMTLLLQAIVLLRLLILSLLSVRCLNLRTWVLKLLLRNPDLSYSAWLVSYSV